MYINNIMYKSYVYFISLKCVICKVGCSPGILHVSLKPQNKLLVLAFLVLACTYRYILQRAFKYIYNFFLLGGWLPEKIYRPTRQ